MKITKHDNMTDSKEKRHEESGVYKSRLKYFREDKGMSQSELAKASGVSLRTIQAFEMGYRDINKAQVITVLQLAEALECDVYDIINNRT